MLIAYGDESYDGKAQRSVAVAAVFGTADQWTWLRERWSDRTGGKVFHASDCECGHREYAKNTPTENKALFKDLVILIAQTKLMGFGVAFDLGSKAKFISEMFPDSTYHTCFNDTLITIAREAFISKPPESVHFIFDRHPETESVTKALYSYLYELPEWKYQPALAKDKDIEFASREEIGIQVADLWTREVMKRMEHELDPTARPVRRSFQTLAETNRFGGDWYKGEYFKGWGQDLSQRDAAGTGPFTQSDIATWLEQKKLPNTLINRLMFMRERDQLARHAGDEAYFADARQGMYRHDRG